MTSKDTLPVANPPKENEEGLSEEEEEQLADSIAQKVVAKVLATLGKPTSGVGTSASSGTTGGKWQTHDKLVSVNY